MHKLGGISLVAVFALAGCTPAPMGNAAAECSKAASTVSAYNKSADGDGTVEQVKVGDVDAPRQHPDGGDAYYVDGASNVTLANGRTAPVDWTCFTQRADGKTHAALTKWRQI